MNQTVDRANAASFIKALPKRLKKYWISYDFGSVVFMWVRQKRLVKLYLFDNAEVFLDFYLLNNERSGTMQLEEFDSELIIHTVKEFLYHEMPIVYQGV